MRINNDFIIIGVDAGYGNMKTANTIFPTGLAAMDTKPYFDGDIMHYNGRWMFRFAANADLLMIDARVLSIALSASCTTCEKNLSHLSYCPIDK